MATSMEHGNSLQAVQQLMKKNQARNDARCQEGVAVCSADTEAGAWKHKHISLPMLMLSPLKQKMHGAGSA